MISADSFNSEVHICHKHLYFYLFPNFAPSSASFPLYLLHTK